MLILILILILHFIQCFGISQIEDQSKKLWEIISKCEIGQGLWLNWNKDVYVGLSWYLKLLRFKKFNKVN